MISHSESWRKAEDDDEGGEGDEGADDGMSTVVAGGGDAWGGASRVLEYARRPVAGDDRLASRRLAFRRGIPTSVCLVRKPPRAAR